MQFLENLRPGLSIPGATTGMSRTLNRRHAAADGSLTKKAPPKRGILILENASDPRPTCFGGPGMGQQTPVPHDGRGEQLVTVFAHRPPEMPWAMRW
jgi:hypothetical protein